MLPPFHLFLSPRIISGGLASLCLAGPCMAWASQSGDLDASSSHSQNPPTGSNIPGVQPKAEAKVRPRTEAQTEAQTEATPQDLAKPQAPPASPKKPQEPSAEQASTPAVEDPSQNTAENIDIEVEAPEPSHPQKRAASDVRIGREILELSAHPEGIDLLRLAPGVYIGQGEGAAVAHNYMLRGFDAKHGQDIEFHVGGLPINLPSHIHGQGYADLGFLIADTVGTLNVQEGTYDPRQGDFAVAGSIGLDLFVERQGRPIALKTSYGAFNRFTQQMVWAPKGQPRETFGAIRYSKTDGFGQNRAGQQATAILQVQNDHGRFQSRIIGIAHGANAQMAGVLRKDDINAKKVCFLCTYPYPTALAQRALAQRALLGAFISHANADGSNGEYGLWFGYDNFRLQANYTGYIQSSRTLERVSGRGDLIEQKNRVAQGGLMGRYRSAPLVSGRRSQLIMELGGSARVDSIGQNQNLLEAKVRNQIWDRRVDASVVGFNLGLWGDLQWDIYNWQLRVGGRANALSYDIEDRLGNLAPLTRPKGDFITGFHRSASGLAAGPRASARWFANSWLQIMAAYGEGFRSPQARMLEDAEKAPYVKVRSADLGLRIEPDEAFNLQLSGYYTHLSDDIAFDAQEGQMSRVGASQRLGATAYLQWSPQPYVSAAASATYVHATLLEPPPPTAEDPQPPYNKGQRLPFVPPLVLRADAGIHNHHPWELAGFALVLHAGVGFSMIFPRPLPYGGYADPVALLDASFRAQWHRFTLGLDLQNLLNRHYAAVEYAFASDWDPNDGFRPRTPRRHISAGAPWSWLLSAGVEF